MLPDPFLVRGVRERCRGVRHRALFECESRSFMVLCRRKKATDSSTLPYTVNVKSLHVHYIIFKRDLNSVLFFGGPMNGVRAPWGTPGSKTCSNRDRSKLLYVQHVQHACQIVCEDTHP